MPTAQVTLTTHNVAYSILSLIQSATQSTNPYPKQNPYCKELIIAADSGNSTHIIALVFTGASSPTVASGYQFATTTAPLRMATTQADVSLSDYSLVGDTDGNKAIIIWNPQ